jgi:hypothetical protein
MGMRMGIVCSKAPLYVSTFAGRAAVGGRYPRRSGRAMYYSARATALMQPPARERARRVVNGAGVRRQQGHLSGRATAWVERNDSLRAVLVTGGSSMQVQSCHSAVFQNPSRDGRCRHHLSSVKTSSPGKWGDTTGIPLALQQTVLLLRTVNQALQETPIL